MVKIGAALVAALVVIAFGKILLSMVGRFFRFWLKLPVLAKVFLPAVLIVFCLHGSMKNRGTFSVRSPNAATVSDIDIERGFKLESVVTNAAYSYELASNGVRDVAWHLAGGHSAFGQDNEWVAANFTNSNEILSVGYSQWVDDQVGVDLTNGLYKLTVTVPEKPLETTQLKVGDYSVAVTNNYQQADTGTKMIHIGKNTRSRIISKGISAGKSQNAYRGLVRVMPNAENVRNYSQCDSLLLGDKCGAHTFPTMRIQNPTAIIEHEATTSKISEDQLFYCQQRGIGVEDAVGLIVNGYAKEVMDKLPMEFAIEAQKLLSISLEGSVG